MIIDKVRRTVTKYNLIHKKDRVLCGVSGGPDSVALLYVLHSLSKKMGFKLNVAHLDHMLRRDSFKDREFVRFLCAKLHIPFHTASIDIRGLGKKGSVEETARKARLSFLIKVAGRIEADKIALGHNFDDQAETVLMRILRGTGLYGLAGILPKRNIGGYLIIRPLIELRRSQIESFLRKRKIKARLDTSNLEDIYMRNRIRLKLLPLLKKEYNRNIQEVLSNLAESSHQDYDYLSQVTERTMLRMKNKLSLGKLAGIHPSIRRLLFRRAIANLKGDTRRITFKHTEEIEDLILNRPLNSIVDLPKGISVIKRKKSLSFYRNKAINA